MYNDSKRKTKPFKNFQSGIDHNDWQVHIRFSIDSRRFYHLKEQTKTRNLDWYNIDCGIDGNVLTMASSSYSARSHRYKIYFLDAGSLIESYDLKRNISLDPEENHNGQATGKLLVTEPVRNHIPLPGISRHACLTSYPPNDINCFRDTPVMIGKWKVERPFLAINLGIFSDDWC